MSEAKKAEAQTYDKLRTYQAADVKKTLNKHAELSSEKARNERIENIFKARTAIIAENKEVGELKCPICKQGKLRYSIARSNKHVHAACTTATCVRWME